MADLKTLKDMDHRGFFCQANMPEEISIDMGVSIEELKQEAIKWIKHYELLNEKEKIANKQGVNYLMQEWIKHFFNITDADLKEELE